MNYIRNSILCLVITFVLFFAGPRCVMASSTSGGFNQADIEGYVDAIIYYLCPDGPVTSTAGGKGVCLNSIIIKEKAASAIEPYTSAGRLRNTVRIEFPPDVVCYTPSRVNLLAGDLVLDPNSHRAVFDQTSHCWGVEFDVITGSTIPSIITIDGIALDISWGVPSGALNATLMGNVLVQTEDQFPGAKEVASIPVVNIKGPESPEPLHIGIFELGGTSFILDGAQQTMTAAPFISDGRCLLPARWAAQVWDASIFWEPFSQHITLIKGNRVVQTAIGSTTLTVNGAVLTMDAAPRIYMGNAMIAANSLVQALGGEVSLNGNVLKLQSK